MATPTSVTFSSNTYSLVQMPSTPGPKNTVFGYMDTVG